MAKDLKRTEWMKEMGRRLEQEIIRLGIRSQRIADQLGKSKQTVSHWMSGTSEITSFDLIRLRALGIDSEFVATGTRWGPSGPGTFVPPRPIPTLKPKQILALCQGKLELSEVERTAAAIGPCSDRSFAFDVFDNAMLPNFKPGTTRVAVDPKIVPAENGGVLVVLLASDDVLFRRMGPVAIDRPLQPPYVLIADNPDWPTTEREVRASDRPVVAGGVFQISYRV